MRLLITGAYGFLGAHIANYLKAQGHDIVGAGRDVVYGRKRFPDFEWLACDFNHDTDISDWLPRLEGIDAVINCVGILQGTARDRAKAVHVDAPKTLFAASQKAGIKRVIQISALGAGSEAGTIYASSKASGDAALSELDLEWVILRPSLVIARDVFGGTALVRNLAAIPFVTPLIAGEQRFQPVHVDDLSEVINRLLVPGASSKVTLNIVGPGEMTLAEIVRAYRTWLRFPKTAEIAIPRVLVNIAARLGDAAGWLGARYALRTTALKQMDIPIVAPVEPMIEATGVHPRTLEYALRAEPAELQDRWHARLGLLKPVARAILALFWIVSGLVLLDPVSFSYAAGVLVQMGMPVDWAAPLTTASGIVDVILGTLLLMRWRVRDVILAQLAVSAFYIVVLSISLPGLWLDALGVLTKVIPIMVFSLMVLAIEDDR